MTVFEKVREIIVDNLNVDPDKVTPDAHIKDDLGADSIDAVSIILELEDTYGIKINTDDIEAISTVSKLVSYVESATK